VEIIYTGTLSFENRNVFSVILENINLKHTFMNGRYSRTANNTYVYILDIANLTNYRHTIIYLRYMYTCI